MMRQAISPRLAIRIFLNTRPHPPAKRVPPSPRTRGEGRGEGLQLGNAPCSQRDVVVLFPWVGELLVAQHGERAAEPPPGVAGQYHVVDKAAARRNKRIGEFLAIFLGARLDRRSVAEVGA